MCQRYWSVHAQETVATCGSFFDQAIPETTARKLGCAILTRAMESRHQLGLDSYDRFFLNQDTMPKGGLGNLIALPLQKLPRADGNSVFVDAEFRPYNFAARSPFALREARSKASLMLSFEKGFST
jgi:hypothetical protein